MKLNNSGDEFAVGEISQILRYGMHAAQQLLKDGTRSLGGLLPTRQWNPFRELAPAELVPAN
jgi:hypothetical protein